MSRDAYITEGLVLVLAYIIGVQWTALVVAGVVALGIYKVARRFK